MFNIVQNENSSPKLWECGSGLVAEGNICVIKLSIYLIVRFSDLFRPIFLWFLLISYVIKLQSRWFCSIVINMSSRYQECRSSICIHCMCYIKPDLWEEIKCGTPRDRPVMYRPIKKKNMKRTHLCITRFSLLTKSVCSKVRTLYLLVTPD
jgi:hypothetical protein